MYPLYFDVVFKEIAQYYIKDDEMLTMIGSVSFASNSIFKLIIGIVLEYVPARKVNVFILIAMFFSIITLKVTVQGWFSYMCASFVIMGCEGAYVTLQAVLTMQ